MFSQFSNGVPLVFSWFPIATFDCQRLFLRHLGIGNVTVRVVMRDDRTRESKYFLEAARWWNPWEWWEDTVATHVGNPGCYKPTLYHLGMVGAFFGDFGDCLLLGFPGSRDNANEQKMCIVLACSHGLVSNYVSLVQLQTWQHRQYQQQPCWPMEIFIYIHSKYRNLFSVVVHIELPWNLRPAM